MRLHPKSFGATGNGKTDDTPAFRAALAMLKRSGGGVLYLETGRYRITDTLVLDSSVIVEGEGRSSVIDYVPANGSPALYRCDVSGKVVVRDIRLLGPGPGSGDGFHFENTTQVKMFGVDVSGFGGGAAVNLDGAQSCSIVGCDFRASTYGVRFGASRVTSPQGYKLAAAGCIVTEAQFSDNIEAAVVVDGAACVNNGLYGCIIQGNHRDGVLVNSAQTFAVENCYFETNNTAKAAGRADLRTAGSVTHLMVRGMNQSFDPGVTPASQAILLEGDNVVVALLDNISCGGDIRITPSCLDTYVRAVASSGAYLNQAANTIDRVYRRVRKSMAWTPGPVAAGAFVSVDVEMGENIPAGMPASATLSKGWVPGTVLTASMGYRRPSLATVTLHNLTGLPQDYPEATVTVDVVGNGLPYAT
jgi:hypothetical protein